MNKWSLKFIDSSVEHEYGLETLKAKLLFTKKLIFLHILFAVAMMVAISVLNAQDQIEFGAFYYFLAYFGLFLLMVCYSYFKINGL